MTKIRDARTKETAHIVERVRIVGRPSLEYRLASALLSSSGRNGSSTFEPAFRSLFARGGLCSGRMVGRAGGTTEAAFGALGSVAIDGPSKLASDCGRGRLASFRSRGAAARGGALTTGSCVTDGASDLSLGSSRADIADAGPGASIAAVTERLVSGGLGGCNAPVLAGSSDGDASPGTGLSVAFEAVTLSGSVHGRDGADTLVSSVAWLGRSAVCGGCAPHSVPPEDRDRPGCAGLRLGTRGRRIGMASLIQATRAGIATIVAATAQHEHLTNVDHPPSRPATLTNIAPSSERRPSHSGGTRQPHGVAGRFRRAGQRRPQGRA